MVAALRTRPRPGFEIHADGVGHFIDQTTFKAARWFAVDKFDVLYCFQYGPSSRYEDSTE
jgi:hypothetical protein